MSSGLMPWAAAWMTISGLMVMLTGTLTAASPWPSAWPVAPGVAVGYAGVSLPLPPPCGPLHGPPLPSGMMSPSPLSLLPTGAGSFTPRMSPASSQTAMPRERDEAPRGMIASGPSSATWAMCGACMMPPSACFPAATEPASLPEEKAPEMPSHRSPNQPDMLSHQPETLSPMALPHDGIVSVTKPVTLSHRSPMNWGTSSVKNVAAASNAPVAHSGIVSVKNVPTLVNSSVKNVGTVSPKNTAARWPMPSAHAGMVSVKKLPTFCSRFPTVAGTVSVKNVVARCATPSAHVGSVSVKNVPTVVRSSPTLAGIVSVKNTCAAPTTYPTA